jgi:hypothetical protein
MLKNYIFLMGLVLVSVGTQEEVMAGQSLKVPFDSQTETLETGQPTLEKILAKMKNNDFSSISPKEMETFGQAVKQIQEKIKKAGDSKTGLSSLEIKIYGQDAINHISPTIDEILESGLKYKWGIDLDLVEKRGGQLRKSIAGGGADFSSIVTSFQKLKEDAEIKKNKYTQEKEEAHKKIMKITAETKEKINALSSVNFLKRPAAKQKILADEKAALEPLQKTILDQTRNLKGVADAFEQAIKNIMTISKLPREKIERLPSWREWEKMKLHPETIPQEIGSSVLSRVRHSASPRRPQQPLPYEVEEQKQQPRSLPPVPKSSPPS